MRPSTVSFPLQKKPVKEPDAQASGPAIKTEVEAQSLITIPDFVAVPTGPDTEILVEVKGMTIDVTDAQAMENLELDWKAFASRGNMKHVEARDAVFFKRDDDDPTKVAKEWRHPADATRVREDIKFEQPWCDPEYAHLPFTHFVLTPDDAKLYAAPAERAKVLGRLAAEALTDLEATKAGKKAPSAEKTYVDTLWFSDVGEGEEILVEKKERGLFASKEIGKGFQFLGWYAMAEMTESQLKNFLKKHGYTEEEAQAYGMDMKVPLEGQTRAEQEQAQAQRGKRGGKKPERALISGTAIGGGNKMAFANTATKEGMVPVTRQRNGVRYKTRQRLKVTDRSRVNAFFMPTVIPFIDKGERKFTVGMGMIGYNLEADKPVLVDYGPEFVRRQLNPGKNVKTAAVQSVDAEMSDMRIKEEPLDEDMPVEEMAASAAGQANKRRSTAEQMASFIKRQRRDAALPVQEGAVDIASAPQLDESAQRETDWNRVKQALRTAFGIPDLGVSHREDQALLMAGYARATANGTTPLTGDALQELGQTRKLLAGLEREGWDMPAWVHACRTHKDWDVVDPPPQMLTRWEVSREDVAHALSLMGGQTRVEKQAIKRRFLPEQAENIALFRDEKFLKGCQGVAKNYVSHVFLVMKWLEKGVHPIAGAQGPQPPCSSLREWLTADDRLWEERRDAYTSSYKNQSIVPARSGLNCIRRIFHAPVPLSDAALELRRQEEPWKLRIPGFAEVKYEEHRNILKNYYHELVEQDSLGENRAQGGEAEDLEIKRREIKRRRALSGARTLLSKMEEKELAFADWVGQRIGMPFAEWVSLQPGLVNEGRKSEAIYKQLKKPLRALMGNTSVSHAPFINSNTAWEALEKKETSEDSSSL